LTCHYHRQILKSTNLENRGKKTLRAKTFRLILLALLLPALSGCWYAAAAGAGAAVTYYGVEKGYKAQSPVTHETPKSQQEKE
jgi:hypothetical protein